MTATAIRFQVANPPRYQIPSFIHMEPRLKYELSLSQKKKDVAKLLVFCLPDK